MSADILGIFISYASMAIGIYALIELFLFFASIPSLFKDSDSSSGEDGKDGKPGKPGRDGSSADLAPLLEQMDKNHRELLSVLSRDKGEVLTEIRGLMSKLVSMSQTLEDILAKQNNIDQGLQLIVERIQKLEEVITGKIESSKEEIIASITELGRSIDQAIQNQTRDLERIIRDAIGQIEIDLGGNFSKIINMIKHLQDTNDLQHKKLSKQNRQILKNIVGLHKNINYSREKILADLKNMNDRFNSVVNGLANANKKLTDVLSELQDLQKISQKISSDTDALKKELGDLAHTVSKIDENIIEIFMLLDDNLQPKKKDSGEVIEPEVIPPGRPDISEKTIKSLPSLHFIDVESIIKLTIHNDNRVVLQLAQGDISLLERDLNTYEVMITRWFANPQDLDKRLRSERSFAEMFVAGFLVYIMLLRIMLVRAKLDGNSELESKLLLKRKVLIDQIKLVSGTTKEIKLLHAATHLISEHNILEVVRLLSSGMRTVGQILYEKGFLHKDLVDRFTRDVDNNKESAAIELLGNNLVSQAAANGQVRAILQKMFGTVEQYRTKYRVDNINPVKQWGLPSNEYIFNHMFKSETEHNGPWRQYRTAVLTNMGRILIEEAKKELNK